MVVVERKEKETEHALREKVKKASRRNSGSLTTPDLVLLSLLAERPMHGYQANAELERREIRDWAAISRPQVYYSLEKLAKKGLIRAVEINKPAEGPQRQSFRTTARGKAELTDALGNFEWATQRARPSFLTWMALSWLAPQNVFRQQLRRRHAFISQELARETKTLASVLKEVGNPFHEAVWMLTLMIEQFKTELRWLERVVRETEKRGAAIFPDYTSP